jgi:ketosteroid isomerase-like protein
MSQENVEIVRRLYEAVARRDTGTVLSLYDPDVEWDGSRSRWAEVMPAEAQYGRGHEELRSFFRLYYEMWESFEDNVQELIDAGEQVISVVTSRGRGRTSGVEVEWAGNAGVWTIRDGKIIRVVWFKSRAEALEAVGLSEQDAHADSS